MKYKLKKNLNLTILYDNFEVTTYKKSKEEIILERQIKF